MGIMSHTQTTDTIYLRAMKPLSTLQACVYLDRLIVPRVCRAEQGCSPQVIVGGGDEDQ
jgi:hypothetical protein